MKNAKKYIIGLLVLSVLVFVKAKFFSGEKGKGKTAAKGYKKPPVPVSVFVVGDEHLANKIYTNGKILANEAVEIKTEVSGRLVYLYLPEGKQVKQGTLLLRLNDAEYEAQLLKIKAQLALASSNELRTRQLLESHSISKTEYETGQANLASLKADSAYIQSQIAKTKVYAPFSGIVGVRNVSLGSYLSSSIVAANIHQTDQVKIDFTLPERYASLLKVGDAISFTTEGASTVHAGKITVKDPMVDQESGSIRYRAISNNPKGDLIPGSFARVTFQLKENADAVFIPTEAIVPVEKGKKVYLVKEGEVKEQIVETGIRTENYLQILSGLKAGDSVVIKGNFQLKNNSPVKVSKKKVSKIS